MSGWYELNNTSEGQFRFILKSDTGETLLVSATRPMCASNLSPDAEIARVKADGSSKTIKVNT